jgi:hypothetical protein
VQSCICICAGWILGGAGPHTNIIIIAVLCYTCSVLCLLEQPRVYKTRAGPLSMGRNCTCVLGVSLLPVCMVFRFYFGSDLMVWYLFVFRFSIVHKFVRI